MFWGVCTGIGGGFRRVGVRGRRLATIGFVVLVSPAMGDVPYSSKEHWGFYTDSCRHLPNAVDVVRKQMQEGSDGLFTQEIRGNLERMADSLSHVAPADKESQKLSECEEISENSRAVLAEATEYEKGVESRRKASARVEHEASPLYKKARALGFADYDWLTALGLAYRKLGEKKLRNVMIVVDLDCGAHFRAIQRVDPYVIFSPAGMANNACSGRERVAVIPAEGVSFGRGERIDRESYYLFQGVINGTSMDGFPTKLLALKQVLVGKKE